MKLKEKKRKETNCFKVLFGKRDSALVIFENNGVRLK